LLLRRPAAQLAFSAVVLLAPSLLLGTLISQSSPQNLTWAAQFADQIRAGIVYPRWMPDSFDGLGGPAFYFYPPLPFWIDGLVNLLTFGLLPVVHRLPLTWALLLWSSGLAMCAWLESETGNRRISFWGALAYMAAPYHLYDHYARGALAEFAAYVFLPLVLISIRRPAWLALAYAGLLMSHLPTAMLVTITTIVPFALFRLRTWRGLLSAGVGGLLGVGVAGIYLLPAVALQAWISSDQLWTAFYDARRWLLLVPSRWPEGYTMQVVVPLAFAYFIASLAVLLYFRPRTSAVFFAVVALTCLGLMAGVVPWFWDVPLFAKVQFPWRLLVAAEFAVVSALCLASANRLRRQGLLFLAVAGLVMIPAVRVIVQDIGARIAFALTGEVLSQQDAKEYEPRGYPLAASPAYAQLGLGPLADTPLVSCAPTPRICRAEAERFGTLLIEIEGDVPIDVVLRRFSFPAWRLDPAVPLTAKLPLHLLSFTAAPGHHTYHLERTALPEEQWGWVISGVSLLLVAAAAVISARSSVR
jgi:hypothetical protein